jgi:NOL1/NOP2/fmu family ribosome biogenesis protein
VFFDSISFENVVSEKTEAYQCFRFLPHKVKGEGFFTAVFQKAGQSEGRATRRGPRNEYFRAPSRKELDAITKLFSSESDHIISKNNELFRLPCEYETFSYLLGKLFITKPGLLLGELIREEIIPAHDIAMLPNECSVFSSIEVDEPTALSYLRKEDIKIETPIIGWALLTFKGVNLGWIKVLKNRVNNYYPKEWKIRMS